MYRARNINGWGQFSNAGYLFAADNPTKPHAPTLVSVTSTTISLQFYSPLSTGGSEITSYELWMDNGAINTPFT
jgi:hypothetical protein